MNIPNPVAARQDSTTQDDQTGLPGLRTWPRVYLLVAAAFILWVVLLLALTKMFA
jgi:hypothetical protein